MQRFTRCVKSVLTSSPGAREDRAARVLCIFCISARSWYADDLVGFGVEGGVIEVELASCRNPLEASMPGTCLRVLVISSSAIYRKIFTALNSEDEKVETVLMSGKLYKRIWKRAVTLIKKQNIPPRGVSKRLDSNTGNEVGLVGCWGFEHHDGLWGFSCE